MQWCRRPPRALRLEGGLSSKRAENVATPYVSLVAGLEDGRTGRFVADGAPRTDVFVMLGDVLAANSDHDDAELMRLLRVGARLDEPALTALAAQVGGGVPFAELLFEVLPEETLHELLYERFRDNLFRFLNAGGLRAFEPLEAVFTENIQTGFDSRALLEELLALSERVAGLLRAPTIVLAPGAAPARTEAQQGILDRIDVRMALPALVELAPTELNRTLALVQDMLDEGMLVGVLRTGRTAPPTPAPPPPELEHTAPARPVPDPAIVDEPPAEAPVPTPVDDYEDDEDTVETPVTPLSPTSARRPSPAYAEEDSAEDDLAAFQDYDSSREGGSFSTERDLLDRVDLGLDEPRPTSPPASTETLIEMEDAENAAGREALKSAVSLNFSGPKLSEDEVQRKLMVTNDVLATIAAAIDTAEGRGAGTARLQLLVESTGVAMAPLFASVELSKDGRLPTGQVVKNLRRRPVSEHRRLLNRALSDLIERALSVSDEVLDEDGLESMLEQIAGYQQRLGV